MTSREELTMTDVRQHLNSLLDKPSLPKDFVKILSQLRQELNDVHSRFPDIYESLLDPQLSEELDKKMGQIFFQYASLHSDRVRPLLANELLQIYLRLRQMSVDDLPIFLRTHAVDALKSVKPYFAMPVSALVSMENEIRNRKLVQHAKQPVAIERLIDLDTAMEDRLGASLRFASAVLYVQEPLQHLNLILPPLMQLFDATGDYLVPIVTPVLHHLLTHISADDMQRIGLYAVLEEAVLSKWMASTWYFRSAKSSWHATGLASCLQLLLKCLELLFVLTPMKSVTPRKRPYQHEVIDSVIGELTETKDSDVLLVYLEFIRKWSEELLEKMVRYLHNGIPLLCHLLVTTVNEKVQFIALQVLELWIRSCWVRMPSYAGSILAALAELYMKTAVGSRIRTEAVPQVVECLRAQLKRSDKEALIDDDLALLNAFDAKLWSGFGIV